MAVAAEPVFAPQEEWAGQDGDWPEELPLSPDPLVEMFGADWGRAGREEPEPDPEPELTCADQPWGSLCSDALAAVAPGLGLVHELEGIETRRVDEYHLVEAVAGWQRIAAWAQWNMSQAAGCLSRRSLLDPQGSGTSAAAGELAPRLGISRFAAKRMIEMGRLFEVKLQDTGIALARGLIDYPKAAALARMLGELDDDVAWAVQQEVLPNATHQTITQLERATATAIISIDPVRATARHKAARDKRKVNHPRPLPDGMALLSAVLPATDAAGLDLALEGAARSAKAAGDSRTIDQLRADALANMGHAALENGYLGTPPADDGSGTCTPGEECRCACGTKDTATGAVTCEGDEDGTAGADDANGADDVVDRGSEGDDAGGLDSADDAEDAAATDDTKPAADAESPDSADNTDEAAGAGAINGADNAEGPDRADSRADAGAEDATDAADGADTRDRADDPDAPVLQTGNSFLRTPHMPVGAIGGRRAQVKVTVPLSVLIPFHTTEGDPDTPEGDSCAPGEDGLPEDHGFPEDWYHGEPVEVAQLEGYGPITPDVAIALAHSGGTWQRIITDPLSGQVLDVGQTRYRPPAPIADFVRTRDGSCVRAGCSAPAQACQLDHVIAHQDGGPTSADNLAPLCGSDHPLKTLGAFQLRHLGGGSFEWTTPTGHRYLRHHTGHITFLGRTPAPGVDHATANSPSFSEEPPF